MIKNLFYKKSFEKLFKENYNRLYYYAFHIINDAEISRDIVSDVFTKVYENYKDLNRDTINSYLTVTVKNKCIDHLRHIQCSYVFNETYLNEAEDLYSDYSDKLEQDLLVEEMLNSLPPLTRHIIEECYFHKKKYKEVAEEMDISPDTVKKHISKALKLLRNNYNKEKTDSKVTLETAIQ